jgi:hypothetical protein
MSRHAAADGGNTALRKPGKHADMPGLIVAAMCLSILGEGYD